MTLNGAHRSTKSADTAKLNKLHRRAAATICLRPLQVDNIFVFIRQVAPVPRHVGYLRHQQQVDLLTLKVVSESRVTWATSVPILVFLGLSVLELGPTYATDRQTSDKSIA